jgi:hypothetical protein
VEQQGEETGEKQRGKVTSVPDSERRLRSITCPIATGSTRSIICIDAFDYVRHAFDEHLVSLFVWVIFSEHALPFPASPAAHFVRCPG